MAAAVANRPRNHAHQPDAAAAVDQADAPPHLRDATREKGTRTTLTYQRTQKNPRKQRRGQASRRRPGAPAERGEESSTLPCTHARTHALTSSWPSSSAASANTFRCPALLPQKTQIVRNLQGTAAAPSPMSTGHAAS